MSNSTLCQSSSLGPLVQYMISITTCLEQKMSRPQNSRCKLMFRSSSPQKTGSYIWLIKLESCTVSTLLFFIHINERVCYTFLFNYVLWGSCFFVMFQVLWGGISYSCISFNLWCGWFVILISLSFFLLQLANQKSVAFVCVDLFVHIFRPFGGITYIFVVVKTLQCNQSSTRTPFLLPLAFSVTCRNVVPFT